MNTSHAATKTIITRSEGTLGHCAWRQYCIIRDNSVTILDLVPAALAGWKIRRVDVQGNDDWCGMNADAILAFKGSDGTPINVVTGDEATRVLETEARHKAGLTSV